jgi:hypothetical protein
LQLGIKARAEDVGFSLSRLMSWMVSYEKRDVLTSIKGDFKANYAQSQIQQFDFDDPRSSTEHNLINPWRSYPKSVSMKRRFAVQAFGSCRNVCYEFLQINLPATVSQDVHPYVLPSNQREIEKLANTQSLSLIKQNYSEFISYDPTRQKNLLAWEWTYHSYSGEGLEEIRAEGTLMTDYDLDGDGWYNILSINGRHNCDEITGLFPAGESIPGNSPFQGDNLIRVSDSNDLGHGSQLSGNGFQFALDDGSFVNVFFASFLAPAAYLEFHSREPFPEGNELPNTEISVWFEATPDFA